MSIRRKHKMLPREGGFLEVLKVALPLILSSSCHALNMFVDRLMLARYSQEAVSAAFTSGLTNFTLSCILVGTISYVGTFVAQYEGARHRERIGAAVWQGIWLALGGWVLFGTGIWWAEPLFQLFGHDPAVTQQEVQYFQVLSAGIVVLFLNSVLPCFWTGRGKTSFVLAISAVITLCNIPLNYAMIFGHFGFPEMGILGAAWGTILAEVIGITIYCCVFFAPSARRHYRTDCWKLEPELMKRLLRFGFPNGANLALDLLAFNVFSVVLGCYGVSVHEASSITFGINNIAFCPVLGMSTTASILVGQAIGAENVPLARKSVRSCLQLVFFYNVLMILLFTVFQDLVLSPFVRPGDPGQAEALRISGLMLYFIACYLLFDGFNLVFSNALRGAGDTQFTMYTMMSVGLLCFALPSVLLYLAGLPWWTLWIAMIVDIILLAAIFGLRFRQGKWTRMRVIEMPAMPE